MKVTLVKQTLPSLLKMEVEVPTCTNIATVLEKCSINVEEGWSISVWNELADTSRILEEGDRIELCAPLLADPKEARRLRQQRQELAEKEKKQHK